jgi:hypothetical protein
MRALTLWRMKIERVVVVCALVVGFAALAEPNSTADEAEVVTVEVGKTTSVNVGYLRGIVCDDLSVVQPDIKGDGPSSNAVILNGLKEGSTYCRAGTAATGPWKVFKVKVVPHSASTRDDGQAVHG